MNKKPNFKQRSRTKGKFNNQSGKDRVSDKVKEEKYNDPSWYVANGQLLKDFASLSFNNALGARSTINFYPYDGDYEQLDYSFTSPGIMAIRTTPAMGISIDGSSALNLAAKNFYTWIRHQNSGHVNYDSPDLMMYFGAMDSIYSLLATMIRAYGMLRAFSQVNRYIGDALVRASGFYADDLRAQLSDFRGYINMVITKVSAFCTPVTMSMFKRHFWMYSGVYRDEDVIKSQNYMYVPGILWKYVENEGPGHLEAVRAFCNTGATLGNATLNFQQTRALMDTLLSAVVSSEDINIMSGDILKAYGRENLWTLSMIPEDYVVFPIFSQEVLDQIHNTQFAGNMPVATLDLTTVPTLSLDRLGVIQDPEIGEGALFFKPQFLNAAHLGYAGIIDMNRDEPTPEDIIVATRNMLTASVTKCGTGTDSIATLTGCGSDICLYATVVTLSQDSSGYTYTTLFNNQNPNSTAIMRIMNYFNKYPRYMAIDQSTRSAGLFGEIDNYTVVSHDDVQRMHDTAILSLMGVPFLGTGSKT